MYIPEHFRQTDEDEIWSLVEAYPFGLLLTVQGGEPYGTHLPFLVDRGAGALLGHIARANPQRGFLGGGESLAVFTGPHAYVSPAWYGAGEAVPTWNYAAVHVYGRVREVAGEELLVVLRRSVEVFDREGWVPDEGHMLGLAAGVVGLRMEVARLEGKWKLSQNQPEGRRAGVMEALGRAGGEGASGVAALMRRMGGKTT